MTIAQVFDYRRPDTIDEAVQMLADHGGDVRVLAGGTDLVAWLRDEAVAPDLLVDIKRLKGLSEIVDEGDALSIGSLVTFADLINSELVESRLPLIAEMSATVASTGIRNRATLVGNICSAVPSCDAGPPLLVHGADGRTRSDRPDPVQIAIDDWFLGPRRTALTTGEIVTKVIVPIPPGAHGAAYVRLEPVRRRGSGPSQCCHPGPRRSPVPDRLRSGSGNTPARPAHRIPARGQGAHPGSGCRGDGAGFRRDLTDHRHASYQGIPVADVGSDAAAGIEAAVARLEGNGPSYGTNLM